MNIAYEYVNAETTILGDINMDYKLRHTNDFSKLKNFERDFQLRIDSRPHVDLVVHFL